METDFFFRANRSESRIEGIELRHPSFSREAFYIVRNPNPWMQFQMLGHSPGVAYEYQFVPLKLKPSASKGDLDFGLTIELGDLGKIIPDELARIEADGTMDIKPTAIYRAWRSGDLSRPISGPIRLQVEAVTQKVEGSSIEAAAPFLNLNRTGETYSLDRFPMLRGFL